MGRCGSRVAADREELMAFAAEVSGSRGHAAMKLRILVAVRHPVGGIRTFLRYVHARLDPALYTVFLVLPESLENEALRSDFSPLSPTFYSVPFNANPFQFICRLLQAIRSEDVDVIHSHGLTAGVYSAIASTLTRTPHVVTLHDVFSQGIFQGLVGRLKHLIISLFLRLPDRIHCVSHDAYDNLLEFFPGLKRDTARITVIPNGIEVDRFARATPRDIRSELGLSPEAFLLGFFGRFMSPKGFKYLVDAIGILVQESLLPRPLAVLTFNNDGFYREEQERVRHLGLGQYFRFLSFEPNIGSTLASVDAVVHPSVWETCPLVPMEAMVAGVPVIGTNCIGLREVLADTPSRICPPRDSLALAREIHEEIVSSTKPQALLFRAEAARRFDVRERAMEIEAMLRSVGFNRRPRKPFPRFMS